MSPGPDYVKGGDFSKYTPPGERVDVINPKVGLCGIGRESQILAVMRDGQYQMFNPDGVTDKALKAGTQALNQAWDQMQREAEEMIGEPGYEDAEVTLTISERGLQPAYAQPLADRRPVKVGPLGQVSWIDAGIFFLTFTLVRPRSLR